MVAVINRIFRFLSLSWLTGPIFGKELRIVSRRRRHYLLRFGYLAMLSLFVVITWVVVVESGEASARSVYKMSEAGKAIIATISWFQFLSLQLIAVILMSTSISDEVYHGTLGVLMTTPITSLQIVAGKLLSKLLHLAGLLLISLPLLAIVRVFGGVPLGYVIAGGCITLTASMFAGAVAMFFSTLFRRAYASILLTLAVGFCFYAVLPLIVVVAMIGAIFAGGGEALLWLYVHINPFAAMTVCTSEMANPTGGMVPFLWYVHCLFMLAVTVGVVFICVRMVRRAALRKAFGRGRPARPAVAAVVAPPVAATQLAPTGAAFAIAPVSPFMPPAIPTAVARPAAQPPIRRTLAKPIRRITGSPLIWKKLRTPMLPGRILRIIAVILSLGLVVLTYSVVGIAGGMKYAAVHASYVVVFVLAGITATAVFAATSISSEKESRTLPVLLTTPLGDWHIIAASVLEVFRRSLPVWLFLIGHIVLFTLAGLLHPIVLVHLPMLATWVIIFLTGTGLYFSSRFKRTTPAVVMNLALALTLWAVVPMVLSMILSPMLGRGSGPPEYIGLIRDGSPLRQAAILTAGAGRYTFGIFSDDSGPRDPEYNWACGNAGPVTTTFVMSVFMLGYSAIGFLFLWRAKVRLRRNLF